MRWWWFLATIGLFTFIGWRSALEAESLGQTGQTPVAANVWDAFLVVFAGPGVGDNSLLRMLTWFVPHLLFFYLIGDLANEELARHGYAVIPLIGSRLRWWWGKLMLLLTFAIIYTLLGFLAVLTGAFISSLPWSWQGSALLRSELLLPRQVPSSATFLVSWTLLLFGTTLFAMASLQTILAIIWQRSYYGFIAIVIVALLSWFLTLDERWLIPLLPGSQSMLIRHTVFEPSIPGFPLVWSLLYNVFLSLLVALAGTGYVRQLDIWGTAEKTP